MTTHSVADARNHLSELIDRAMKGEAVVITRHGSPVAELRPIPAQGRPMSEESIAWLRRRRVRPAKPDLDPRHIVERMRDE